MPTKVRKKREQAKQRQRERLSSPPEHIKARIDARRVGKQKIPFSEVIKSFADSDRCDLMRIKGNYANIERRWKREADVDVLKKRYQSIWGKPGGGRVIAVSESLSVRTVQKYFKDFP